MASKTPALSTQLKNAQAEITKLQAELKRAKEMQEIYSKNADAATKEVEAIQVILDALPGAIDRRKEGEWTDRTPVTRLAAWFACRA